MAGHSLLGFQPPRGHDAVYYFPRHVEFEQALADGQMVPRWAPDLNLGYGEPLFNFTPPLFYYLTAAVHSLGIGLAAASSLAALSLLATAGLGMYLLARDFFGPSGGLIAASAYLFAPYLLVTLYVRYAMGDFAAFAFVPIAFWGTTRFARDSQAPSLAIGSVATALLLLSSNHVALITIPCVAAGITAIALANRSVGALARGATTVALGVGMAAFFWLPALLEHDEVYIGRAIKGAYAYFHHFVYPEQLLYSPWGYGGSVEGPGDGLSLSLGTPHLILAALLGLSLLRFRKSPRASGASVFALGLVALASFFATDASARLWAAVPTLQFLQFPWRFLSLGTVALSFACGAAGLLFKGKRRFGLAWTAGVVALFVFQGFPNARPDGPIQSVDETLSAENVAAWHLVGSNANEFEPINVQATPTEPPPEQLSVVSGQADWEVRKLTGTSREFTIDAHTESRLRLNTSYFPGWVASVDGAPLELRYDNQQAALEIPIKPGLHEVRFDFTDTDIRVWATRLSLASLVVLVSLLLTRPWRRAVR